jgi:hypothetical protein
LDRFDYYLVVFKMMSYFGYYQSTSSHASTIKYVMMTLVP